MIKSNGSNLTNRAEFRASDLFFSRSSTLFAWQAAVTTCGSASSAPGRVVTDMMLRTGVGGLSAAAAGLPLRRMGDPAEVARTRRLAGAVTSGSLPRRSGAWLWAATRVRAPRPPCARLP